MYETLKQDIEKKYNVKKQYYRAPEVAIYLSISVSTVWLYAKQGKLKPKKLSSRVTVFNIDEINSLLNNVEVT